MFDAEIDWMCRKEEGGAPGWLSAFWSVQMAGWECCPPRHETRKMEAGAWLGGGRRGGDGVFCLGYDEFEVLWGHPSGDLQQVFSLRERGV